GGFQDEPLGRMPVRGGELQLAAFEGQGSCRQFGHRRTPGGREQGKVFPEIATRQFGARFFQPVEEGIVDFQKVALGVEDGDAAFQPASRRKRFQRRSRGVFQRVRDLDMRLHRTNDSIGSGLWIWMPNSIAKLSGIAEERHPYLVQPPTNANRREWE